MRGQPVEQQNTRAFARTLTALMSWRVLTHMNTWISSCVLSGCVKCLTGTAFCMFAQKIRSTWETQPFVCVCVCVRERERERESRLTEKGTGDGGAWDFQYDPKKYFRTKSPFSKPKQSIRKHELRWPAFYVSKASPRTHTDLSLWNSWSLFLHAWVLWL